MEIPPTMILPVLENLQHSFMKQVFAVPVTSKLDFYLYTLVPLSLFAKTMLSVADWLIAKSLVAIQKTKCNSPSHISTATWKMTPFLLFTDVC